MKFNVSQAIEAPWSLNLSPHTLIFPRELPERWHWQHFTECTVFREKQLSQGGVPSSAAWSFQAVFGNESNSHLPWSSPKVAAAAWPGRHWFCSSSSSHLPGQPLLDVFTICTFFTEQENQDYLLFFSITIAIYPKYCGEFSFFF